MSLQVSNSITECRPKRGTYWRRFRNRVLNRFIDMFEGLIEGGRTW